VTLEDQEKRMRKTRGWAGLRAAAIALGLSAGAAGAGAASIQDSASTLIGYSTSGSIGLTGITGRNVISFANSSGTFTAPSAFSLGEFSVSGLNSGESTTYTNTPFSITFLAQTVDNGTPIPNQTPVTLTGVLNGTFTGSSQSDVVATFNPLTVNPFQTGAFQNQLAILGTTVSLVPSTTNGGRTTVQGQDIVTAVPEPASIVAFVAGFAGLALLRRRGRVLA
jgi:hypothetical protein